MITENLSTLKIHKLTQTQYDTALATGNIDETALYLTPDEVIYNKVLCDSGNVGVSVFTDGTVEIPEINDYSIFSVYLHTTIADCVVLCTKTEESTFGTYISGSNCFDSSSNSYYFKFQGTISGTTLTLDTTKLSTSPDFSENEVSPTVSKIVGVM